jgi:ubiquinone/menaquinone biosynthesis C-methylase UbiE
MDDPSCDPEALEQALDALTVTNRWFGGLAAVRKPIARALAGRMPGPLDLLDVGTGAADIPRALERWLRARGWTPAFCLTDNHATTLRVAKERAAGSRFVRLSAPRLPFSDDAFDISFSGTMLHHLETAAASEFLRELDRVSRFGWVVSDLRRGPLGRWAVDALAATLWRRNPMPRQDGPASIRRAFTPEEINGMLAEVGLPGAMARGAGPFRWVALGGELARA